MKKYIDTEKLFEIYRDYLSYDKEQYKYWINKKYDLLVVIDEKENMKDIIEFIFKDFEDELDIEIDSLNNILKYHNFNSVNPADITEGINNNDYGKYINNYIKLTKLLNDSKFEEHIKYRISNCIYVDVEDNCENQTINKSQNR